MKLICENPNCLNFGIEDESFDNTYQLINGKLQSKNAICPLCGQVRKEINGAADIPLSEKNIQLAKYASASKEGKTDILKKRSHEHYEKKIKPFKEFQMHEAIDKFKNIK